MEEKTYWEIHDKALITEFNKRILKKLSTLLRTLDVDTLIFHKGVGFCPDNKDKVVVRLNWHHWAKKDKKNAKDPIRQILEREPLTGEITHHKINSFNEDISSDEPCSLIFRDRGLILEGNGNYYYSMETLLSDKIHPDPLLPEAKWKNNLIHEHEADGDCFAYVDSGDFYYLMYFDDLTTREKVFFVPMRDYKETSHKHYPRMLLNSSIIMGMKAKDMKNINKRIIRVREWKPKNEDQKEIYHSFEISTIMDEYEVDQKFLVMYPQ